MLMIDSPLASPRQIVDGSPSITSRATSGDAVAVTAGVSVYGAFGSRSRKVRSSIQTVPFPPVPAVTTISICATRSISPPPRGPQANSTWRFCVRMRCHSRGYSKRRRFIHHTFSPDGSMSLNSRSFTGASARMRQANSQLAGRSMGIDLRAMA